MSIVLTPFLSFHVEQAEAAGLNVLSLAAEEAEKNPTPELALREEARQCEARVDWAGAEACYHKVLALARTLGHCDKALAAAGDPDEASNAFAQSQNLWCEIGLPELADR